MSISDFLNVQTSQRQFPSTNALQARIREVMAAESGDQAERLAAALAFAIVLWRWRW